MKKGTYILIFMLLSSTIVFAQKRAKNPLQLLKIIHKLAVKKKYNKLNPYLYQGVISDVPQTGFTGKRMAELILKGMQESKIERADFSFDADALKEIIEKHSERIVPIPEKLREELFGREGREFSQFKDLKAIANNRPKDIVIFDYKGVHILMAKIKKGYQLVFWEGLKSFGKKENSYSTEPKKPDDGGK